MRSIKDSAFNINLLPGIAIIFAKSALLAAMTLFISTFATSTLFTIIIATAVYFIGHLQATAVDFWLQGADQQWWLKILLGAVALIFPDLQAFNLADDVVAGTAIPLALFLKTFGPRLLLRRHLLRALGICFLHSRAMKRKLISLVLLALFGAALLPFETALQTEQKEAHFRSTKLDLPLRAQVGQMGFLAALSGFRSPLAMYLWLQAYDAWEKTEWGKMAGIFDLVTTLQPRSLMYWDTAAWHMAWNASQAAIEDPNQPSEALRKRAQQQYFKLGKEYLERGIANNPDRYNLYERLGDLLRLKLGGSSRRRGGVSQGGRRFPIRRTTSSASSATNWPNARAMKRKRTTI